MRKIVEKKKNCAQNLCENQLAVCAKHGTISGLHSQPLPLGLSQHNRRIKLTE